ncbi:HAMP domain-containing histidine kinase [Bacillus sp. FJAT-42376]|uniref:two-component system histidine kinase PnpS n=1 Tax=Bacillus sp. FJAT-42376 TaxID=2014076 RepID=UPI000F4E5226|nr:ATP-binding protein [Bacillus sp. FJAT-42376]AZB43899.1 HAMP domain-containing histidine kinase [Bacillus sp. FJAT-42376]
MNKFRSRLLFALITLIISVLVGLGLLLGQIFNSYYVDTFKERIEKETRLMQLLISEAGIQSDNMPALLQQASSHTGAHITVLNESGRVLYDAGKTNGNEKQLAKEALAKLKKVKKDPRISGQGDGLYYYGVAIGDQGKKNAYLVLSTPIESLKQVNQQIWGLLATSLGLSLIVILLLGFRITSQYTKPIESATKVAMELAKGNYKARTFEDHMDETGMLSQSINILARNLQDMTRAQEMQKDRLETLIENMGSGLILIDGRGYINLVNRAYKETFHADAENFLYRLYYDAFEHKEIVDIVEEIFMTEVRLRRQLHMSIGIDRRHFEIYGAPIIGTNDEWKGIVLVFHDITELKKLEQMRKDFVANVSHELKTPITSIKGFSETLLDGAMSDKQTLEYFLSIILKESDRLQSLIQDLLDLSKIEQQAFKLTFNDCNLHEIMDDIVAILSSKAEEKEITLLAESEADVIPAIGDVYRIKQIFINLINNALTYTPKGGSVHITLRNGKDHAIVTVADTGIGISEDEIPRIFERFYRVDKARSRNSGGTGLGLAIVKHLVEAHRGQIHVTSQVGKGTTFTVKFNKREITE